MYFGSVRFFKHLIYICLIIGVSFFGTLLIKLVQSNLLLGNTSNVIAAEESDLEVQALEFEGAEAEDTTGADAESMIGYQSLHPDLYHEQPVITKRRDKIAYLTFDDGPSARTIEILDILKEKNIKATFFVITENKNLALLERVQAEGHTIAIHSNSHKFNQIYRSVEDFLADFHTCYTRIYRETSVYPQIFRFPGGSINSHNRGIYEEIIAEMLRRGFLFFDWNISTQDSVPAISAHTIVESVKNNVKGQRQLIILGHDALDKTETVKALPEIIRFLQEEGYTFDKLDNSVQPIVFTYE